MRLTPHFTLGEVTKSQYALRHGIDNTLNQHNPEEGAHVQRAWGLAQYVLEPVRCEFGTPFSPSSWYRCPELNTALGGSKTSDHLLGAAADIEIASVRNIDLAYWISRNLKFKQLILEYPDINDGAAGWVHVSYLAGKNDNEVLTKTREGYFKGLPDLETGEIR